MDITAIIEVVNTVGFPIACVVVMFYMLNKERETHKEENERMIEALNNNTIVLENIKTILQDRGLSDGI